MVNHKILIVEDDAAIAGAITRILDSWQMESRCVRDFRDVLREFTEYDPHLVLMDVTLPFFNGYHWCSEIRKISAVPVLFVSSAAENMNIVMAVDMGGDDFIAKPFDPAVLMAKIRALLRRTYDLGDRVPVIEHRGAVLNLNDGTLLCDGKKTELTRNEFRILQTLLESRGKVVSRETLMTRLWEYDLYVEENTLTVNMTRLRKKLAAAGLTDYITTRVGSGYIIEWGGDAPGGRRPAEEGADEKEGMADSAFIHSGAYRRRAVSRRLGGRVRRRAFPFRPAGGAGALRGAALRGGRRRLRAARVSAVPQAV